MEFVMDTHSQIIENRTNYRVIKNYDMVMEITATDGGTYVEVSDYDEYLKLNIEIFAEFKKLFINKQNEIFIDKLIEPKQKEPDYSFAAHIMGVGPYG